MQLQVFHAQPASGLVKCRYFQKSAAYDIANITNWKHDLGLLKNWESFLYCSQILACDKVNLQAKIKIESTDKMRPLGRW